MPTKDVFHEAVKNALIKDGWVVTHDPLFIQFGGIDVYIDLGAERIIAAEKKGQKIAVEIKSFVKPSVISEFHLALGQFINYRMALNAEDPDRVLYLVVPNKAIYRVCSWVMSIGNLQSVIVFDAQD